MNPPPLPKPGNQKSIFQQLALGSLVAPLLAILVSVAVRASSQGAEPLRGVKMLAGGVGALFILVGFALAIVALCGMSRHGPRGILGRSVAGLVVNGAMVAFLLSGFVSGFKDGFGRGLQSRQAVRDIQSASKDLQQGLRESYDPEKGITNLDAGRLDRLTAEMKNASGKMSGNDALIMQAMSSYLAGLQKCLKQYETAVTEFTGGGVLGLENLTDKSQIEPRRAIVHRFLEANATLKQAITNSEQTIRTSLVKAGVPSATIETVIRSFNAKAAPRQSLTVQIRECDRRMGDAALGALDLLEAQWGRWRYAAAANEVTFTDSQDNEAYGEFLTEMNAAAEKQIKLQGLLVKLE